MDPNIKKKVWSENPKRKIEYQETHNSKLSDLLVDLVEVLAKILQIELNYNPTKTKTQIQKTEIDPNQRFGREKEIEIFTLAPLFVDGDDFVDEFDVGETTALGFANEFGVATFLYSEEIDVQHFESIIFSAFFVCKLKLWGEEGVE